MHTQRRSRMRSFTSVLLVIVSFGAVALSPYLVFRDDFFARLIDRQTQTQAQAQAQSQISYEDQLADLRS